MATELIARQQDLYRLISNASDNLRKIGSSRITRGSVQVRSDQLDRYWQKFESQHDDVVKYQTDVKFRDDPYFTEDVFTLTQDAYFTNKAEFLDRLEELTAQTSSANTSQVGEISTSNSRKSLPKIDLPSFSGRFQEWTPFRDLFVSMVGQNESLAAVEKLHYLKISLKGEAAKLIAAIPVTEENYDRAWEKLQQRFENKRALINAHLETLFALKPLTKKSSLLRKSAQELERLRTTVDQVLEALKALGGPVEHWDFFVVYFVCQRLDADTHEAWELKLGNSMEPPKYAELNSFLESRVRALENVDARTPSQKSQPSTPSQSSKSPSARVHTATPSRRQANTSCACCSAPHYISLCSQYRDKTPEQRRDIVVEKRLCYNCLGNHMLANCTSPRRCLTCGQPHHTTLHLSSSFASSSSTPRPNAPVFTPSSLVSGSPSTVRPLTHQQPSENSSAVHHAARPEGTAPQALLATAVVNVMSSHGRQLIARALLDQGSELSFVCESLVQALQLPRQSANIPLCGIGAQTYTTTRGVVTLRLQHRLDPAVEINVEAYILSRLTGKIPAQQVPVDTCAHLSDLELADPQFHVPSSVDLLLGANIYAHLLQEEVRKTDVNSPVAQRTLLGWVISGPIPTISSESSIIAARSYCCSPDQQLSDMVRRFWSEEQIPDIQPKLSDEDRACEEHFEATHSRDLSGRYIVRLPFRSPPTGQAESQVIARRMLNRIQVRFQRDSTLKKLYADFLREYLDMRHMERLTPEEVNEAYFLPHHGVLREISLSTKLRVVFNASQKLSDGSTLNDSLFPGPKLQVDLMDVLLRWRLHAYVFSSDVEKMYRQIRVHPDDQKHQSIIWSEDTSGAASAYKLCTVTYGMNCAPYLALRVLRQLANDEGHTFPLAADIIRKNIYVDDVLSGADDPKTAQEKAKQVDNLFKAGGFLLKKWVANKDTILDSIEESRRLPVEKIFDDRDTLRALGLKWSPLTDSFIFNFKEEAISTSANSKREVLSDTAKLFDPLGWLAPVVVSAKIFLQELWKTGLQWDNPLPLSLGKKWNTFIAELKSSAAFSIPRWVGTFQTSEIELHGFADASQAAMAAVLYIRVIEPNFTARSTLLVAKTRVAPLKPVTIARLELSAAVLLAQLVTQVQKSLDLSQIPTHLWTDSSVALTWIRGNPSRWKDYVCNRVALIKEIQPNAWWHHVSGAENPADAASRGMTPKQLKEYPSWWSGPDWLTQPSTAWPNSFPPVNGLTDLEERPATVLTASRPVEVWKLVDNYGSLEKFLRVTSRLFDATDRFRRVKRDDLDYRVLPQHLRTRAFRLWIRKTQEAYFSGEIAALTRDADLPRSSPLLRLCPFVDSEGLLRVGGRLERSSFEMDVKHPYILPRISSLTTLLIDQAHRRTLHGGAQLTLSILRQRVWIVGGRAPVKSFIRRCVSCTRQRGATLQQKMGQLPESRITPARAFLYSGVDYAGPFVVKTWRGRNAKTYKAYLVLFVCFATSAVHLELTSGYSTDGFLAAFRRFTGRRGRCAGLTSDCGANFVGADAELKKLFAAASEEFAHLRSTLADDGTEWVFNPPSAPHFGGKWEAAVKSTKFHLRRVVGDTPLTYEEFSTLLAQIEGILNSRPLCPISDDPSDLSALTPGHLLTGEPITSFPEPSLMHLPTSRLNMFQRVRQMLEHFWARWSREYLQRFQTVSKWLQPNAQLHVGSLVLVADERYPPGKWPLARVVELHPGTDGLVRVASVRMSHGTVFRRPIVKLCLLPVESSENAP